MREWAVEHVEREVKIAVSSAAACLERLAACGAEPLEPRRLEDDRLFDDAEGSLQAADRVLRLRRKGPARVETGLRVREEVETGVADAEALTLVLERLGLVPRCRYQKLRSLLRLDGALVAVDETPLGDFVEIEGEAETIERIARRLGYGPADYLTGTYPSLWRESRGPEAGDMLLEDEE